MKFKHKTLQEHIWFDMEHLGEYSTWDWVIVFEHYNVPLKNKDYKAWVKELKSEGRL